MANYYCMIAGLPDIDLKDAKPGLSIEEMREQCEEVLTPGDRKLLFYFFLHFDCVNLVKLLKNPEADIDQWGNFTLDQLRDLITSATELNYTAPLIMLASLGVAALLLGLVLKAVDKKKGLGLEEPNIK